MCYEKMLNGKRGRKGIKRRAHAGFSMIEILFVVTLLGLIVGAIAVFFRTSVESWKPRDARIEMLQNARVGMDEIIRNFKGAVEITAVSDGFIRFTSADGTDIRFRIDGNVLQKRISGTSWQSLAEPVESMILTAYDAGGAITVDPGEVRSLRISLAVADPEGQADTTTVVSFVILRKDLAFSGFDVVINEINYHPPVKKKNENKLEWVELYNYGGEDVDMTGCTLSDSSRTDTLEPGGTTMILPAGGYGIITANTSDVFLYYSVDPSAVWIKVDDNRIGNLLDNDVDSVTITDPGGNVIDSVEYQSSWGGSGDGDTLERRSTQGGSNDPSNWEASGAYQTFTAGTMNSVQ